MSQTATEPSLRNPSGIDLIEERGLKTRYGDCTERLYRYQNSDVVLLIFGVGQPDATPVRIHSTCFSAHYLGSVECDCREQLEMTLDQMGRTREGVVVFLDQDGRGNGHAALMRSTVLWMRDDLTVGQAYERLGYPADARDYRGAGLALLNVGISRVRLLTNNPDKAKALEAVGIAVATAETSVSEAEGPWLTEYYRRKAAEGHTLVRFAGESNE